MRTYKLLAGGQSSAADAVANCLITRNGRIKSVRWEGQIDQVADNSVLAMELSVRPTNQLATNDTIGDISCLRVHNNLVTSGVGVGRLSKQELVDFPIAANERLYLHIGTCTTTTTTTTCYVDVAE